MTNGDTSGAPPAHNSRLVATALVCVWLAVGSVLVAMALLLINQHADAGLIIVSLIATLLGLQIPAIAGAVALSILGGMWRSSRDAAATAALLLAAVGANLMLWPITVSLRGLSPAPCTHVCTTGTSTKDLWIGGGAQAVVVLILLASTTYWLARLWLETPGTRRRIRVTLLAVACAAILLAIDLNVDGQKTVSGSAPVPTFPASGHVSLNNDTDQELQVVYCPRRICTGQHAQTIPPQTTVRFTTYATNAFPDSFVTLGGLGGGACTIVRPGTDGVIFLSLAGGDPCGDELQTLAGPH